MIINLKPAPSLGTILGASHTHWLSLRRQADIGEVHQSQLARHDHFPRQCGETPRLLNRSIKAPRWNKPCWKTLVSVHASPAIIMSTESRSKKRIVVTGGSGVVGRCVIEKLLSYGHEILNVDQTPLDNPKVHTLKADLTDGAQAFNALSCHFQISEPFLEQMRTPDVVIHLAGTYLVILSDIAVHHEQAREPAYQ